MNRTDFIGELAAALAKSNLEIRNAELDRVNPHFKNRYATLGSILNAIRIPLAKNGIAPVQTVSMANGMVTVTTSLIHASGQAIEDVAMFPLPNNATVQQMGSCITYLRRYALAAIVGIVGDEDDDGENDRATRLAPVREAFKPTQARGAVDAAAKKPTPAPAPAPTPVQAEPIGDWIAITVKYADEGVAGKNQTPYVKLKDSNGNAYFVWDEQLHGVAKAVQGQTVWIITEASKKADAPPRVTQIRMKPPEPASIAGDIFDEQD
jgi:hypothetical protein